MANVTAKLRSWTCARDTNTRWAPSRSTRPAWRRWSAGGGAGDAAELQAVLMARVGPRPRRRTRVESSHRPPSRSRRRSPTTARVRSSSRSGGRAVGPPEDASNMPATATASVRQTSSRFSALMSLDDLDGEYLLDNYLTGFRFEARMAGAVADFYDEKIANAIAKLERSPDRRPGTRRGVGEARLPHHRLHNYAYVQLFRIPCQASPRCARCTRPARRSSVPSSGCA